MGQSLSWLFPPALIKLFVVESHVRLRVKSANDLKDTSLLSLEDFLRLRCPSLFEPFQPVWYLKSGHLQTGYCVVGDFSQIDHVVYDRTLVRLRDGGTLGLDETPPKRERIIPDNIPIIVVMHGLTGGSHESYVRAILAQATKPKEEGGLGYRGIVVNFRGCAGVQLTSGQLYSAGHTDDLRQALMYISQRYPKAQLLGLGFSLGANVIVRYLSEEGRNSRLRAACILACPWDLVLNSKRLEGNFILRHIYSKAMASNLANLMKRNASYILRLSDDRTKDLFSRICSLTSPTLVEFDDVVTKDIGGSSPPFPFPTAWHYYAWASSHQSLQTIGVPLLAINSADDPIVGYCPLDVGGNGLVALAITSCGGHLGWFEAAEDGNLRRWMTRPTIEWMKAVIDDLVDEPSAPLPLINDSEWTTESGRSNLGFKLLGGVGEIEGTEGEEGLLAGL